MFLKVFSVILGGLFIIIGSLAKFLMDRNTWPRADVKSRARALFQHLHLGPDLVIFALALIASVEAMSSLRLPEDAANGTTPATHVYLIHLGLFLLVLLLTMILWTHSGQRKFFPLKDKTRTVREIEGDDKVEIYKGVDIIGGLRNRECQFLLLSDFLGLTCVVLYCLYVIQFC